MKKWDHKSANEIDTELNRVTLTAISEIIWIRADLNKEQKADMIEGMITLAQTIKDEIRDEAMT